MAFDLKSLSPSELRALIDSANAQMEEAKKTRLQDVRAKIDTLLKSYGLTLDEVYSRRGDGRIKIAKGRSILKGSTVAPKYRNPEDPNQTWTGRGRQPGWVVAALNKRGATLDSLLISGEKVITAVKKTPKKPVRKGR